MAAFAALWVVCLFVMAQYRTADINWWAGLAASVIFLNKFVSRWRRL